jgi:hypothetical protein
MRSFSEHSKAVAEADQKLEDANRHRCHYEADGMRCTALGVICESAVWDPNAKHLERRWLCMAHHKLRGDRLGSREVISDLARNQQPKPRDWRADMLEARGLGELRQAWRDMSDEEKAAMKADAIRKARGVVRVRFGR